MNMKTIGFISILVLSIVTSALAGYECDETKNQLKGDSNCLISTTLTGQCYSTKRLAFFCTSCNPWTGNWDTLYNHFPCFPFPRPRGPCSFISRLPGECVWDEQNQDYSCRNGDVVEKKNADCLKLAPPRRTNRFA